MPPITDALATRRKTYTPRQQSMESDRVELKPQGFTAATTLLIEPRQGGTPVLYTFAVVLLILWLLGVVSGYTIGAFIHVLLVIALVMILVQFITGRRVRL
jgi:hypothetical protein